MIYIKYSEFWVKISQNLKNWPEMPFYPLAPPSPPPPPQGSIDLILGYHIKMYITFQCCAYIPGGTKYLPPLLWSKLESLKNWF